MKRLLVLAVAAIVMASCGGGEFGTVGKKFDPEEYGITAGTSQSGYIAGKDGKQGSVLEGKISAPPIFDKIKGKDRDKDGKILFIVEKDGKQGLYKAFEKDYMVPCEYEIVDVNASVNLIFLKKHGEEMEKFRLDTREKVVAREVTLEEIQQMQKEKQK